MSNSVPVGAEMKMLSIEKKPVKVSLVVKKLPVPE